MDRLLKACEVAKFLAVSPGKLEQMIRQGKAPAHIRIGRLRRWPQLWVFEWVAAQRSRDSAELQIPRGEQKDRR
ncbi:MAG: helix-turn-helix domain-containing protein [Burkholderiales bacterium]